MEADRADPEVAAELAGHELEEDLGLAVDAATADTAANTRPGYGADLADFQAYCAEHRVPALPAAPAVIAAYLAVRAHRPPVLAPASLARRLAAIRKVHELNGYRGLDNPGRHPDVQRAWAGIRRQRTWTQQQAPAAAGDTSVVEFHVPESTPTGAPSRSLKAMTRMLDTANSALNLLLVGIGLYLANNLRRQLQLKMVDRRFESYSRLWELLEDTGPWRTELGYRPIELEERKDLYNKMTDSYFEKGNGMLLAPKTRQLYLNAKFNMICQNRYLRLNFERLHIELDRPDDPEDRKKWMNTSRSWTRSWSHTSGATSSTSSWMTTFRQSTQSRRRSSGELIVHESTVASESANEE